MLNSPLDPPEFAPPAAARSLLHLDWARLVASDCQDTRFLYLIRIGILDFIRVLFCLKLLDFRFQFVRALLHLAWVKIVIGRLKISDLSLRSLLHMNWIVLFNLKISNSTFSCLSSGSKVLAIALGFGSDHYQASKNYFIWVRA